MRKAHRKAEGDSNKDMRTETWYVIANIIGIANIIVSLWIKSEFMYFVLSIEFVWALCLAIFWEARYNEVQEKLTELQQDYKQSITDNSFHEKMRATERLMTQITDPMCICLHRQSQHMSMGTCRDPNCHCAHFSMLWHHDNRPHR